MSSGRDVYVTRLSRHFKSTTVPPSLVIQGPPQSGKSHLVQKTLAKFPKIHSAQVSCQVIKPQLFLKWIDDDLSVVTI